MRFGFDCQILGAMKKLALYAASNLVGRQVGSARGIFEAMDPVQTLGSLISHLGGQIPLLDPPPAPPRKTSRAGF